MKKYALFLCSVLLLSGCTMNTSMQTDTKANTGTTPAQTPSTTPTKPGSTATDNSGKMTYGASILTNIKATSALSFGAVESTTFDASALGSAEDGAGYIIRAHGEGDNTAAVTKIETYLKSQGYTLDSNSTPLSAATSTRWYVKGDDLCRINSTLNTKLGAGSAMTVLSQDIQVICGLRK